VAVIVEPQLTSGYRPNRFNSFLARDSMLSALYAIARPSVRPSVTRVDQSKTVEARIMQFSPYSSPIPLAFCRISFIQKFEGELERQTRVGSLTSGTREMQ